MPARTTTTPAAPAERWADAADLRRRIGRAIEFVPVIGSTNDLVRDLLSRGRGDGAVVVADEQLAGRGRQGRSWTSPPGMNLMLSVGLRPPIVAVDAWMLSAGAALAVVEAARSIAALSVAWPNDVVAATDGRKVAGILVETTLDGERLRDAVIGIGINVNWLRAEMPDELSGRATSLTDLAGRAVERVGLLRSLLDALDAEVAGLERGTSPLDRYRAACATLGTEVVVDAPGGRLVGLASAIDDRGALVVDTASGSAVVTSGEVTRLHREVPA
jgi:BirA family transcriptional regulator, biotin operon repressor / biotin---[acetyl-CoA-carboxylase] ligase